MPQLIRVQRFRASGFDKLSIRVEYTKTNAFCAELGGREVTKHDILGAEYPSP